MIEILLNLNTLTTFLQAHSNQYSVSISYITFNTLYKWNNRELPSMTSLFYAEQWSEGPFML